MTQVQWKIGLFDRIIVRRLDLTSEANASYVKARKGNDPNTGGALYDMDIVDNKSAALLTHVSLIMAALALLIGQSDDIRIVYVVEFIIYALIATTLLRCVDILGPPTRPHPQDEQAEEYWHLEAIIRRAVYQFSRRAVIFMTLAMCLTVLLEALLVRQGVVSF